MNNNDEPNNNYIVNNEELYRRIIEDLLINLYINRHNINYNESLPINYYDFYYIYNSYINTYSYDNVDDNNNLVYNFIVNAYNEYNSILNTINYNFDAPTPTSTVVEAQAQTPISVLENNGIIFTWIDSTQQFHECCSICLCDNEGGNGDNNDNNDNNSSTGAEIKMDEVEAQIIETDIIETDIIETDIIEMKDVVQVQPPPQYNYVKTSCNHHFHLNCLAMWVGNNKKSCPMCRHDLSNRFIQQ